MNFNVNKWFTRCHSLLINNYILNSQIIKSNNMYTITHALSWTSHVTCKATRMLNFVKGNLGKCNNKVKSDAYATLGRSILEYATQVWNPHQQNLIRKDELQDGSNQISRVVFTVMLNNLGWIILKQRCKINRLTLLHRLFIIRNQLYKY